MSSIKNMSSMKPMPQKLSYRAVADLGAKPVEFPNTKELKEQISYLLSENEKMKREIINLKQDMEEILMDLKGSQYIRTKKVANLNTGAVKQYGSWGSDSDDDYE